MTMRQPLKIPNRKKGWRQLLSQLVRIAPPTGKTPPAGDTNFRRTR